MEKSIIGVDAVSAYLRMTNCAPGLGTCDAINAAILMVEAGMRISVLLTSRPHGTLEVSGRGSLNASGFADRA